MRRGHLQALRPVCPRCRLERAHDAALVVAFVIRETDDVIHEGVLQCSDESCLAEYPIIDSIPILTPDPAGYIAQNVMHLIAREDLGETTEALIGECCGAGSAVDATRQHLSGYTWDHYGEFDAAGPREEPSPGSGVRVLRRGLDDWLPQASAPALDLGCSVGRGAFELAARVDGLVLGVDLNFAMLRVAARVLHRGQVRYPLRRGGMIYDRREFDVRFERAADVDFWACDASAMPFADATFAAVVGLNVLDCMASPLDLLRSAGRLLVDRGRLMLATPYDWSGAATDAAAWIGGHSRRAPGEGRSDRILRALLSPGGHVASVEGLAFVGETDDIPWHVRQHDRSHTVYRVHAIAAEKNVAG